MSDAFRSRIGAAGVNIGRMAGQRLAPVVAAAVVVPRVRRADVVLPAALLATWTLVEGAVEDTASNVKAAQAGSDGGTKRLLVGAHLMGWWLPVVRAVVAPKPPSRARLAFGLAVLATGATLRVASVRHLGRSFTGHVTVHAEQAVRTDGPYGYVRHPAYAGLFLLNIGSSICSGAWGAAGVVAMSSAASIARRVEVEEDLLIEHFGDEYERYRQTTPACIPGTGPGSGRGRR